MQLWVGVVLEGEAGAGAGVLGTVVMSWGCVL